MDAPLDAGLDRLAVLAEPVRRSLYLYVAAQRHDVGRSEAATAVGVAARWRRSTSTGSPRKGCSRWPTAGSGSAPARAPAAPPSSTGGPRRPTPCRCRRAVTSWPPGCSPASSRELGADLAAQAAADRLGRELGQEAAARGEGVTAALDACGFEPYAAEDGIRARNCPFHELAGERPALVCGLGGALVEGVLQGLGEQGYTVGLDPLPGECCVVLRSKTNQD